MAGRQQEQADGPQDVLIAGSGAAGLTAALTIAAAGLRTLVCEGAALLGGTSALSGGCVWVPGNDLQPDPDADRQAAARYLRALFPGYPELTDAFLTTGRAAGSGTYQANRATSSWLHGYTYAIPPTRLIHVDIDPTEIGRNYPAALGVVADAGVFLGQLLREVRRRRAQGADERLSAAHPARARWRDQAAGWAKEWAAHIAPQRRGSAPQLDRSGMARLCSAHHAAELGLRVHGVRRRRRARREAGGTGTARRGGGR